MNEQERSELEWLRRRHAKLEEDLALLGRQLNAIESRITSQASSPATPPSSPPPRNVPAATPPPIPPVFPTVAPSRPAEPMPVPSSPGPSTTRGAETGETTPQVAPPFMEPNAQTVEPPAKRSFELRLGTYWLVRIGIVIVLTGLVLAGTYAYQNFIGRLGPAGKISLLYGVSGLLLGAGAWWQRKAVGEALRNYAQVLFSGGLAAVYFTTYAAHHIPNLRIINSALLDGALLLGWAGFMTWIADRKKSQVLALFAVGLAYYTSVITRVGSFTLYSNLVLTAAAVFFLIRNRWAGLSVASLIATYASYGFWRFLDGSGWHWASPDEGLWFGAFFLMSYWGVFTAAVFLSRGEPFSRGSRAGFLTFNNVAFFVMFLLTMLQVRTGGFWKFSLIYGASLLALAALARRVLASESIVWNSYLTQGLLLVTVGIISKFAGLQLALLLGAESVVLLTLGLARRNPILQIGSYITAALAVGWGIDGLERNEWRAMWLELALGGFMAFNAFWASRHDRLNTAPIRAVPAFFTALAMLSWFAAAWYNVATSLLPVVLALASLVLTLSVHAIRVREFTVLGQTYLWLAQLYWIWNFAGPGTTPPWWNPAILIAVTLGLSHWWQRQTIFASAALRGFCEAVCALAVVGVFCLWLQPLVSAPAWFVVASALAIGVTIYAVATRAWYLAGCAQIFLAVAIGWFGIQLLDAPPRWYFPLAPVAAAVVLSAMTVRWFQRRPDAPATVREPLLQVALIYRCVALMLSLWWVLEYVPARDRVWFFGLLGLGLFAWTGWKPGGQERLWFSGVYWTAAFVTLAAAGSEAVYWPTALAVIVFLAQERGVARRPERYGLNPGVRAAGIVLGGMSLWLLLTRWVLLSASGFYLTASWSALALALFSMGIVLKERVYRWVGLIVLAGALGRVVLVDIWKLETLYRILSLMALGIVLLVLGFIYNKYQEKIREWL